MSGSSIVSPYHQMTESLLSKIKEIPWVEDENVELSDCLSNSDFPEGRYPYIDVRVGPFGNTSYEGQTNLEGQISYLVQGYLFQEKDSEGLPLKDANLFSIMDSGAEVQGKIFSFEDDKILGNPPCQGYESIVASTDVFVDPQLDDSIMTFMFAFSVKLINLTAQP